MDKIADFFANNIYVVSIINFFSGLGLLITIYAACSIREIKNSYLFKARAPEHLRSLKSNASKLLLIIDNFDSYENNGNEQLGYIKIDLNSMKKSIKKTSIKNEITGIVKLINNYKKINNKSKLYLRNIYTDTQNTIYAIDNYNKDIKWEN